MINRSNSTPRRLNSACRGCSVRLSAPTGTAALLILGFTIGSALDNHLLPHGSSSTGSDFGNTYHEGTVYMDGGVARYVEGSMEKDGAAYGYYNNSLQQTGWGTLEIRGGYGNATKNVDILYAAGFLEGVLTAEQIWQNYQNLSPFFMKNTSEKITKELENFLSVQDAWVKLMIQKHGQSDPFWRHVAYIRAQFQGLYDGYKSVAQPSWNSSVMVVQVLNLAGDLLDLMHVINSSSHPDVSTMTENQFYQYVTYKGHCSALIKVMGAYEDLFMGHSSWFTYSSTMRIYKIYDFNVNDPATAAKKMAFSSYAGFLESLDDYYQLSSNMVMLQTTNNIFNLSLYNLVKPQSLFAWQRVRIANMMANSGQEWTNLVAMYNSGTYNNQYMVVDLKPVQLGLNLGAGTLWVAEQIPGLVVARDQTSILRMGYWPSYNVPFYEEIYNSSGYPDIVNLRGYDFSYQLAPRAKIFRRDQGNVVDLDTMKDILRYNDYLHDPYSKNHSCNTICCRGDLEDPNPRPDGCYDTKVSDLSMAYRLESDIISGPTRSHGLPAFNWSGPFESVPHLGLPNSYNFDWVSFKPKL